jgi:hypothetical protein
MQATFPVPDAAYPVRVEGHLAAPSRGLWLLKWLLVIPHYIVLAFLWLGFVFSAVLAFLVVFFTGRYPRALFDFNAGVMRWSWRVGFYAFAANGTDRYPPFTLEDVPDYPARLAVDYPVRQRRGLPLVGWWLAGLPQYIVAGIFAGGGAIAWTWSDRGWRGPNVGLIGLLVFVAVLVLLVRGRYPRQLFDFVLGLNRWALRVCAYAAVMTPEYPPFRLDGGEEEPGGTIALPAPVVADTSPHAIAPPAERWGPGRVVALVVAALVGLASLAFLAAGITGLVLDGTRRDAGHYLMTSTRSYATSSYALVSASYRGGTADDWFVRRDILGTVRLRVRSADRVFVGIGREADVNRYLAGVAQARGDSFTQLGEEFRTLAGRAPRTPPAAARIWSASTTGAGQQRLDWRPRAGAWRIVVMDADGSAGVRARVSIGARLPHLSAFAWSAVGVGVLLALASGLGGYLVARRRGR